MQFAEQLRASVQVAIDDQSVDFRFAEAFQRPLWFVFDGNSDLESAKDALQNADFLPVTRDHNRGKCHVFTVDTPRVTP